MCRGGWGFRKRSGTICGKLMRMTCWRRLVAEDRWVGARAGGARWAEAKEGRQLRVGLTGFVTCLLGLWRGKWTWWVREWLQQMK